MRAAYIASVLALVGATVAAPQLPTFPLPGCIGQAEADLFVGRFIGILNHQGSDLGNFTQTAELLLADEFHEVSNSILELTGQPLGGFSAPSKQAYIAGISHAPPSEGITTLNTFVAGCHKIVWRWQFNDIGSGRYPVKGFNYFGLTPTNQLTCLHLEFDSVAWGLNTGYKFVYPNGTIVPA